MAPAVKKTTWLITGCSTGLGKSLARSVLKAGFNVVVTARNPSTVADIAAEYPETAVTSALDVRDKAQIAAAMALATERFGGIDVLVNNAGHGYRAAVEEGDEQEVAELFATNFFGAVAMIKAVLPAMRAKRSGAIINISSTAGRRSAPGSGYYSATKFALEGMSDGLRKEVGPLGISVMVVDPGGFRTDFAGRSLKQAQANIADYAQTAGLRRKENDTSHGKQPGDPDRGALAIMEAIMSASPPFRLVLGNEAWRSISAEVDGQRLELDTWRTLSTSTDFPEKK